MIGLVVFLVAFVGYLSVTGGTVGFFRLDSMGGLMPAMFVAVAIVVGVVCVGIFIHRGTHR